MIPSYTFEPFCRYAPTASSIKSRQAGHLVSSCCCRYPVGGDTLSVSTGVISRIEVTSYAHGSTELLAVQIDAAINSGNSGELPACPILQP